MCHIRNEYHLRCGHVNISGILYCTAASFNRATRRRNKCSKKTGRIAIPSDQLCGESDCWLSVYEGRWICCECKYGYRPDEVNRMELCARGGCYHAVCGDCFARSEDNIRRMYAEEEETVDEDEVENSINQDTSMDSIVFEHGADDEDTE
jgi:hypothetical protein